MPAEQGRELDGRATVGASALRLLLRGPLPFWVGSSCLFECSLASRSASRACKSSRTRTSSMRTALRAFKRSSRHAFACSPLHQLLGHVIGWSIPIGILIAMAEMAIGLGTILGLWTRGRCFGRHAPCVHAVPDRELPLVAVLHRGGHRLCVRLDAACPRRIGWCPRPRRR